MSIFDKLFQQEDKIVTDLSVLQQISRKTSFEECDKLNIFNRMRKLVKSGKLWTQGLGLSAIQIGIDLSALYYRNLPENSSLSRDEMNGKDFS